MSAVKQTVAFILTFTWVTTLSILLLLSESCIDLLRAFLLCETST
jgi:hypothetical protein